ncbi:hypothetical protein DL767_001017 [Monosporascus sp. MG133]|nr:hypothetical protein DL767_001017 [Monosporascus sp. MG133]
MHLVPRASPVGTEPACAGAVGLALSCQPLVVLATAGGTTFLDHASLLAGREDPDWFQQNVPFLDVPDPQIQAVYYYRWQTYKEHLVYTGAQYGYLASEFLHPVDYGAPHGGVVAAAGHHITEGRWLRDYRYGQDIANYWLAGPGTFDKPATGNVNADTTDWAHEYSFWGCQGPLVPVPVWGAIKYTAASYGSSNPYYGGVGYRPIINAYQYGDARAITAIAALAGDTALYAEYTQRADVLQQVVQQNLWDRDSQFYKHRARVQNLSGALLTTREIMGYLPKDYNHSTFVDNVITGLIGLRAQPDDSLVVNPLAPPSWDHFALENAAYYGHSVITLWDSTGSYYGQGQGLRVYVDGTLAGSRSTLGSLTVDVGPAVATQTSSEVNIAANGQRFPQGTTAFASYTSPYDDVWRVIDGIVWRTGIPENSRWTSYGSPNAQDHFGVDLRRPQAVLDVRLYFYDDGGGVRRPASFDLQYLTGSGVWLTVPDQQRSGSNRATSNSETQITFSPVVTSQLRVLAPNPGQGNGTGWGLSELEVWTGPVFQLRNDDSGKLMGVAHMSTASGANIQQYDDNGTRDHLWRFVRNSHDGGWFAIQNVNSGLLLDVQGASTANSVVLVQDEDNGTSETHLRWRAISKGGGLFLLKNKKSGLVAPWMSSRDFVPFLSY